MSLRQTIDSYENGKLTRDLYWEMMQANHLSLREYSELLSRTEISSIKIEPDRLIMSFQGNFKMIWNPEDIRTAPNIAINQFDYEPELRKILLGLSENAYSILDIGANLGWYSLHLAAQNTNEQIYAFEPVPSTFTLLQENITLNQFENRITTFNFAIGNKNQRETFFIPDFYGSVAASKEKLFEEQNNSEVDVEMRRLDDLAEKYSLEQIDLIKCDVEGAELFSLQGGIETIKTHQPIILLEMLRKWARKFHYHPNDILKLLDSLGYQCLGLSKDKFRVMKKVDENTIETNFLFYIPQKHSTLLEKVF